MLTSENRHFLWGLFSVIVWGNFFLWFQVLSSYACTDHYSAEYLRVTLHICRVFSLFSFLLFGTVPYELPLLGSLDTLSLQIKESTGLCMLCSLSLRLEILFKAHCVCFPSLMAHCLLLLDIQGHKNHVFSCILCFFHCF